MMCRSIRYIGAVCALVVLMGCAKAEEPEVVSLGELRGLYGGYPRTIAEECTVEGVVVSSDRYGDFRRKLALQDPTGGLFFSIDCYELHEHFSVGDRLRVRCTGLQIGAYGRSVQVGAPSESSAEVEPIPLGEWMARCSTVGSESVVHQRVAIASLSADHIATAVEVMGVRFVEAGSRWSDLAEVRTATLVDMATPSDTLRVRLSPYGIFNDERVPEGECRVAGVADYFAQSYQLVIHSVDGVLRACDF